MRLRLGNFGYFSPRTSAYHYERHGEEIVALSWHFKAVHGFKHIIFSFYKAIVLMAFNLSLCVPSLEFIFKDEKDFFKYK